MTSPLPPTNPGPPLTLTAAVSTTVKAILVALVSLEIIELDADQQYALVMAIASIIDLGLFVSLYFGIRHKKPEEEPQPTASRTPGSLYQP